MEEMWAYLLVIFVSKVIKLHEAVILECDPFIYQSRQSQLIKLSYLFRLSFSWELPNTTASNTAPYRGTRVTAALCCKTNKKQSRKI